VLSIENAKIMPYKHAIVAYGATIARLPSHMTHCSQQKNKPPHCSAMAPPFNIIACQNCKQLSKIFTISQLFHDIYNKYQ